MKKNSLAFFICFFSCCVLFAQQNNNLDSKYYESRLYEVGKCHCPLPPDPSMKGQSPYKFAESIPSDTIPALSKDSIQPPPKKKKPIP